MKRHGLFPFQGFNGAYRRISGLFEINVRKYCRFYPSGDKLSVFECFERAVGNLQKQGMPSLFFGTISGVE